MIRLTTMAIFLSVFSYAQSTYSINGVVKDKDSGELISGAVITVKEVPEISIKTNEYGFYSLSLPENDYTLIINYSKHHEISKEVHLDATKRMDWDLYKDNETTIKEVVINNKKRSNTVSARNKMGAEVLDVQGLSKIPMLLGERDIIKTMQFLPGITSREGNSGFSVRGGNGDQNLILLDEAPVINNSHLLGFLSTFNSDVLKDVSIYKGNIPSQYGGRLSSVVDVKMKDGNNQKFGVNGGISTIGARMSVEGPIQKGKSSFIVSARRSFMELYMGDNQNEDGSEQKKTSQDKLYFYDLNAKLNFQINKNNSIYLSGYMGRDVIKFDNAQNNWGNKVGSLSWNSIISDKLFSKTSLIFSNYDYRISLDAPTVKFDVNPNIKDLMLKQDFTHFINPKHSLKYGFQISNYYFDTKNISKDIESPFLNTSRSMWENAVYINDDYKITDKLSVNYGLRASAYQSKSKGKEKFQEIGKTNVFIEPRVMATYELNNSNSFNASYSRNSQGIQTLSSGDGTQLNDIWINLAKPQVSDQVNLGYVKKFKKGYELSADVYYRKMKNIADYKDGVDVNNALYEADFQDNLLFGGIGRAYGLEFMAKKTSGKFTGWLAYSLSKSERKINGINNGDWYNSTFDKTHNLSIVTNYELSPRWTLSGAFVYATGNAATFPIAKYNLDGQTMLEYGERNSSRMPAYHRLDLNATYEFKNTGRFKAALTFGIYNVYGRSNPYMLNFEADQKNPGKINVVQEVLFRSLPSIGLNFKF
ncbi:TonB-dependent receptor [Chryseobacterium sp. MYb264]|uniref:TonB-dependent receptor n=1 Tax=Chryseobacterium sp. MYb264 TaxID=2745153 RepID=UPI002E119B56|nr:TonB-dependent receptor [Chryseobacterium sp. MYb264]